MGNHAMIKAGRCHTTCLGSQNLVTQPRLVARGLGNLFCVLGGYGHGSKEKIPL